MLAFSDAMRFIAKAGFDSLEVMVTGDKRTQSGSVIRAHAEEHGLSVSSIHAPFLILTRGVFSTDPIEKIKRSVEVAHEAGAPTVVVHPPYRWQSSYTNWLDTELETFAAGSGITVSMENMFPVWMRGRGLRFHRVIDPSELARFPDVTLDTSHLAVAGVDILDAYRELRDKIAHIHLSNNSGNGRDSHAPLQTGVLPIVAFLRTLRDTGFQGSIALEMDIRERASRPADLISLLSEQVDLMREHL
jgi:sugar phosphate isomerase/epimerase